MIWSIFIIIFVFIAILLIFARVNYKIQLKVNKSYNDFLQNLNIMIELYAIRNQELLDNKASKLEIKNKVFETDIKRMIKLLDKYEKITGEKSTLLEGIILKFYLLQIPKLEELMKLRIQISKTQGKIERKILFPKEVLAPWNWFNNIFDILIYLFLDYEYYFLQPQIKRTKSIISKISFCVTGIYILLQIHYTVIKFIPFLK